jgi:hypothetical protein
MPHRSGWLAGAAGCARFAAARRQRHERGAAVPVRALHAESHDDLGHVLHEEIDRLPERFRVSMVLCDLEGRTREQAARYLGWPVGTVKSRLAQARRAGGGEAARALEQPRAEQARARTSGQDRRGETGPTKATTSPVRRRQSPWAGKLALRPPLRLHFLDRGTLTLRNSIVPKQADLPLQGGCNTPISMALRLVG